jgi:DNA repair protein RadC
VVTHVRGGSSTLPDALDDPAWLLAEVIEPDPPAEVVAAAGQVIAAGLAAFSGDDGAERAVSLGLTSLQATRLRMCARLAARLESDGWPMPPAITGPADVLAHVADIRGAVQERVVALYLDARNRPLCRETIAIGGLRASIIQPRDVLAPALRLPAAGLILAHNHPSGDVRPSAEDMEVTRQLSAAVRLFGIEMLDHLVVSRTGYCSLKEMGEM